MHKGQEKFFEFILERVKEDKREDAKALLAESFQKQADRTFTPEYLASFAPRMIEMLKPEHIEEVKAIMTQYGSSFAAGSK